MSSITRETREEALQFALPFSADVRAKVGAALTTRAMTAEEVATFANLPLNSARSRLTELKDAGIIHAIGKKLNRAGTVHIAVWAFK